MLDAKIIKKITTKIETLLHTSIVSTQIPLQGMDSDVFLVKDNTANEYAIKYSSNAINDVKILNLIKQKNIKIPIPKMVGYFSFKNKTVVILEKINFPLLDLIPVEKHHRYIKSMLSNLKQIHTIKSTYAGYPNTQDKTTIWKEFLLNMYDNKNPVFNWDEVILRDCIDSKLIQDSIKIIKKKIRSQIFNKNSYSLLHTDFNQKNIFVDPNTAEIASIIDWTEAIFGDPLYDFSRIRMYIIHFNLGNKSLRTYYETLKLSENEKKLEDLYLAMQILNYIAWYSEIKNDFNLSRIKLHQDFLREYN